MRRCISSLLLAVLGMLVAGCATGLTPESTAMRVPPASGMSRKITITVIENRPYVLQGRKNENFEGVSRELYGIPVSRDTNDDTPMASYLGRRLLIGFTRAGYSAEYVPCTKGSSVNDAVRRISRSSNSLFFAVDMRDWRYDFGGFRPSFKYDVSVEIFSADGSLLANQAFSGLELMPTGGWKYFKSRYAELYQTIFDRILADPNIRLGLAGEKAMSEERKQSSEERLRRLKDMLKDSLITPEDYEIQKKKILDEI